MKRFAIILAAIFCCMTFIIQIADAGSVLTITSAQGLLDLNNGNVKKMKESEKQAWDKYTHNAEQAKYINIEGTYFTFRGEKTFFLYEDTTQLAMKKQKELVPEQLKYSWEMTRDNGKTTYNSLSNGLRGLYLSLGSADLKMQLSKKKLEAANNKNNQDKIKLKNGMITQSDMDESEYTLQKTQNAYTAAKRGYENALRSLSQFIGIPVDSSFDSISFDEKPITLSLKTSNDYIDGALSQRLEITSLKKQLALKQQELKILEYKNLNKLNFDIMADYEAGLREIDRLNLELSKAELSIKNEIKSAYTDIINSERSIKNLGQSVQLQKKNLDSVKAKYNSGLVSQSVFEQYENSYIEMENSYKAAVFNYNSQVANFSNATKLGPAYKKGGV